MLVSVQWMRDYAPLDAPLQQLVQTLVDTGTEVEGVQREAAGAVVARVLAVEPIPESTKGVVVAELDVGAETPVRVVTGAPNVRVGDLVAYAPAGTRLFGLDEPLQVRTMFGGRYRSPGMLCSAAELGIGEDADGILVLEHGVPGQPLHEVLDLDAILEVEVTPNRPDCLSHVGLARELAAALGETLREPPAVVPDVLGSATAVETRAAVRVDDPVGCPRFIVAVIEDLAVAPSPVWLQRRLRAIGLRPINNVVDVTNYVTAELGQPLHAFDLDRLRRLAGRSAKTVEVVVRRAREGETLACLDGVERRLDPEVIVVCAADRPASIAGIIGGSETAVIGSTRRVLLEAATWDGVSIRAASRRLGVRTEASTRFEKGLPDTLPPLALERAAAMIAELGGGRVLRGRIDVRARPLPLPGPIEVSGEALGALLGCPIDPTEAATALVRLGFSVEQDGDLLRVTPPHFRRDVAILADVAEEVGRSLGYSRIPPTLPGRRTPVDGPAPPPAPADRIREVLIGAGFDEVIAYSFVSPKVLRQLPGLGGARVPIALRNPLSEEWSVMRTTLLPGLCLALARNLHHGLGDLSLFEVGRVFWEGERTVPPLGSTPDGVDRTLPPLPEEPLLLGMVSQVGDDAAAAAVALRHCQSVLAWLVEHLRDARLRVEPAGVPGMRPGRSGRLLLEERDVGVLGELDSATLEAFDLRGRVVVAELRVDAAIPEQPRTPRFRPPPRMPAVIRDLSVLVPETARMDVALATITEAGRPLLAEVEPIGDDYRDPRFGEGRKAWTFRLVFRAEGDDRTLTGEEANACLERIEAALAVRCAAEVRR